jgi:hypothetical protein
MPFVVPDTRTCAVRASFGAEKNLSIKGYCNMGVRLEPLDKHPLKLGSDRVKSGEGRLSLQPKLVLI